MPALLTTRPRRARRGWRVTVAVAAVAVAAGGGGCTSRGGDDGEGAATTTSVSVAVPSGSAASLRPEDIGAVTALLQDRAAALVAGDESAYAATVADPTSAAGRSQLASYAAARALRVSRLEVGTPVVGAGSTMRPGTATTEATPPGAATTTATPPSATATPPPGATASSPPRATATPRPGATATTTTRPSGAAATAPPGTAHAEVDVRYRVDDLDRGDRTARLAYSLVRQGTGWAVASEEPAGPAATLPWVAMPDLRVHRGAHGVVAGTAPTARLREHAAVVDRAVPGLRRDWEEMPGRVLVLAPATAQEADALLGRSPGRGVAAVAATTEGPTGADGRATGDRIVLDPTADARLTDSGRAVVLTHELAHVAVQASVPGRAAGWLAEGYADHLGYDRADVPDERLLEPLLAEVRAGRTPAELPGPAELDPASGEIEVPYLAAWQAVELLADEHGEDALRRLLVDGSSSGSAEDAEAATDRALQRVLGTSRAELTRAWQERLRDLAR